MSGDEENGNEIHLVLLGSSQKDLLFKKLAETADKTDRHVAYTDVQYLYYNIGEKEHVVEVTDPGMSHTGGREMAIRRADAVILFYSSLSVASFQQLSSLLDDFRERKNIPIRLICDEDEVIEDEEDGGSTGISSVSEGYESDDAHETGMRRRRSMEKIHRAQEEGRVSMEQGEALAQTLGARFMPFSVANFRDGRAFMEEIITEVRGKPKKKNSEKRRFSLKNIPLHRNSSQDSEKSAERKSSANSEKKASKKNGKVKKEGPPNSKVCTIM